MLPRIGLLFLLYFVQGLPFGFQARALPAYLREAGTSLTVITLAGALSVPWMLKILWAPWVERHHWPRLGRRRTWILPMQALLLLVCMAAAYMEPDGALVPLLALVLLMNMATALMDVAVDGLAVDSLERRHLGYGNIAQVVGYKLGMIASGGLLLAYTDEIGWSGMFGVMAGMVGLGFVATWMFREPRDVGPAPGKERPSSIGQIVGHLIAAVRVPAARWILVVIATYKLGEAMADALFVPFLIDAGFERAELGIWLGTYGMIASLAGSVLGGVIASRTTFVRAIAITAALRALPIAGQLALTLHAPSADEVIVVTMAEHLFGGAITTAMFAFMMAQVDRRIGATHYTLLATVEVLGKAASGLPSGVLADLTSYSVAYGAATLVSVGYLLLLPPLARSLARQGRESLPPAAQAAP